MSEKPNSDDKFLKELEASIMAILKNRKASKADKLSAINAGVRLATVKHKVNGSGDSEEGFFGQ